MAKIKHLTKEELFERFKLGKEFASGDKSPCGSIKEPQKTIFVLWHSDYPTSRMVAVNAGTMYFCREGNREIPLKFDVYSFQWNGARNAIICDKSKKIGYHHSQEIPNFMEEKMPEEYVVKTQEVLERLQKE